MSQTTTVSAVAVLSVWFGLIPGALPLAAEPQTARDATGISVDTNGARV